MHQHGAFFYGFKFIQLTKNKFFLFLVSSSVITWLGENVGLIQKEKYSNKTIISKTNHDEYIIDGMKVVDIANWLLQ